jgi:cytochrome c oxidase subunit 6b
MVVTDKQVIGTIDGLTAEHPHCDDPRFLPQRNQFSHCMLRFTQFCRCARELGEEDVRCKYQFYRAQASCVQSQLDEWMEHRARGTCEFDLLPDRQTEHIRIG